MTDTKPLTDAERAELREIGAAHDEDLFALLDERDRLAAELRDVRRMRADDLACTAQMHRERDAAQLALDRERPARILAERERDEARAEIERRRESKKDAELRELRTEVERLRGRESDALVEMQGLAVQRGISLDAATEEITFLRADLARAQAVIEAARDTLDVDGNDTTSERKLRQAIAAVDAANAGTR